MTSFFPDERARPYNMVCYVRVTFSDGSISRGSGAVVGPNDVLTAAHVVNKGRNSSVTATKIDVFAGYDTGSFVASSSGPARIDYYNLDITSNGSIYQDDSASDLAIIGLSTPIGNSTGTFGMMSYGSSGYYTLSGYPAALGEKQVADYGYASYDSAGTYDISGLYHSPGSSGGPVFDQNLRVVGVVSTTAWASRIDEEWSTIRSWISGNDYLMSGGRPTPPSPAPTLADTPVYRFFNRENGTHFFTASAVERDSVLNGLPQYSFEGNAFRAINSGYQDAAPVYRFYRPSTGTHLYTASTMERDNIITTLSTSYRFEGTSYYALKTQVTGTTPLYRFFNRINGTHFYTVSSGERDNVVRNMSGTYNYEGIAYFVSPNSDPSPTRDADVALDGNTRSEFGLDGNTYLGGGAEPMILADGSLSSFGAWNGENELQPGTLGPDWGVGAGPDRSQSAALTDPYSVTREPGADFWDNGAALTLPAFGTHASAADGVAGLSPAFDMLASTKQGGTGYTGMIFQA